MLVVSTINIVFAVLCILGGIAGIVGGAVFGAVDPQEVSGALSGTGVTQGEASGMVVGAFLFILITSAIGLIVGILGVRAANDNQKIMSVWVLALIDVILYVVGIIATVVNGGFDADGLSTIISFLFAVLLLWVANNIKKQAGKSQLVFNDPAYASNDACARRRERRGTLYAAFIGARKVSSFKKPMRSAWNIVSICNMAWSKAMQITLNTMSKTMTSKNESLGMPK